MKNIAKYFAMLALLLMAACKEEFKLEDAPPTPEDAAFTYAPSADNDNIIEFTAKNQTFLMKWDLGNGSTAEGKTAEGTYPSKGTYTVTLTVYNAGGSVSSTQKVDIAQTDPSLLDNPLYNMLTGGPDSATIGKTWVIDSLEDGHFGVGPDPSDPNAGDVPNYYAAAANEKAGGGMYDDRYTFYLKDFNFDMVTHGDVFINGAQEPNFPGATPAVGDYNAPYDPPSGLTWSVTDPGDGSYPTLTISQGGFLGYYAGTSKYQIISITSNEMFLRYVDQANAGLAWYIKLIRAGYDPTAGSSYTPDVYPELPIDFESSDLTYTWNDFGGVTGSVESNPDTNGNGSANVGHINKSNGAETWAGTNLQLAGPIDFSGSKTLSMQVYSPRAGVPILLKIEDSNSHPTPTDPPSIAAEMTATTTVANAWETLTFDYSQASGFDAANSYDALSVFYDNGNSGTGEDFYFDNIQLVIPSVPLTMADLTGGGSKAWVLKPAAGSFGVGPYPGSDQWFPNGADISGDRPCLYNDLFIFKSSGIYEYDAQGDIFGEAYMGLNTNGECFPEDSLNGKYSEVWKSGTHSFNFTPASGGNPAQITVNDKGAFIALPKAHNGGEYDANTTVATLDPSLTYDVVDYKSDGVHEELSITVDISGTGGAFWSFVLVPKQ